MKQVVQSFGLHCQDDLIFLHEQDRVLCLTPGLDGLESPFEVRPPPRQRCPHVLPLPAAGQTVASRLVEVMAPVPQAGLHWCDPAAISAVYAATAMMARVRDPAVAPWWSMTLPARTLQPKLTLTNCAPLVVSDYQAADFTEVLRLSSLPRTRALVLSGYPRLTTAEDITPTEPLPEADWPALGATFLHDWIRKVTTHG